MSGVGAAVLVAGWIGEAVLRRFRAVVLALALGTDGHRHVVYELQLTNANPVPATLQGIDVLDAAHPDRARSPPSPGTTCAAGCAR